MNLIKQMRYFGISSLIAVSISACTTYTMQAGDYDRLEYSKDSSDAEASSQLAYNSVYNGYSYVTIKSTISLSQSNSALFKQLGCGVSPINLSSRQQDFTLLAVRSMTVDPGAQPSPTQFPLFSFSRNDANHTCQLNETAITLGPFSVSSDSYQIDATVRSSTADTTHAGDIFSAVTSLVNSLPLNPSAPIVGAAVQTGVSTALKGFDSYVSSNLQEVTTVPTTLASFSATDIRNGKLVWSSDLYIQRQKPLSANEKIEVGKLYLTVETRLSLFTPNLVSVQKTDGAGPSKTATGIYLPYVPDFAGYQRKVWTGLVKPEISNNSVQLSQAIDMLQNITANEQILPKLHSLTKDSGALEIQGVCRALHDRAITLLFDEEDVLAIVATALADTDPWRAGASNMNTDKHGCFTKDEATLLKLMKIDSGNESPPS